MFTRFIWKSMPSVVPAVRRYAGSRQFENYYDILQVKKDSTNREIRSAFVNLSKQFHPDTKGSEVDPLTTAKFVKISEAYQTLSRPSKRSAYDQQLWARGVYGATYANEAASASAAHNSEVQTTRMNNNWQIYPDFDPNANPDQYYGFEGFEKVSNTRIASILIVLAILVAVLGCISILQAFDLHRQELDRKSAEASIHYEAARSDAKKFGNKEQLRRLTDRLGKDSQ